VLSGLKYNVFPPVTQYPRILTTLPEVVGAVDKNPPAVDVDMYWILPVVIDV
jgi:hypothetical protein